MTKDVHSPISFHQTIKDQLKVNWSTEYKNEFCCVNCNKPITKYRSIKKGTCKLQLFCDFCGKTTHLTQKVQAYIYGYNADLECPNPLCTKIGANGQKGWVYICQPKKNKYKCRFCNTFFNPDSTHHNSWIARNKEKKLSIFSFEKNIWQLENFYDNPKSKTLNFQTIKCDWYRIEVKKYIYFLLKNQRFSPETLFHILGILKKLGNIVTEFQYQTISEINRKTVIELLNNTQNQAPSSINYILRYLSGFFEWLNLETHSLIRSTDRLKVNRNDCNWLDEVSRTAIENNLYKIPPPIARQYLIQNYIATRPGDTCLIELNCLIEENEKWYIKFKQSKPNRWHKVYTTRKIRKLIEEQQLWITKTFGKDYPYLFCHFRSIHQKSYPNFSNIKPLPEPPKTQICSNPMVRIIRMLIEKENIVDANGQTPHFTGKITRSSRGQEIREKYGIEAARILLDHQSVNTTFQHYTPPTREQIAEKDLPFQKLLINSNNEFLPWQSLPHSLLKDPKVHELDPEVDFHLIPSRHLTFGYCALESNTPCPYNLHRECYSCNSFRPSTSKLPLYKQQYEREKQRLAEAEKINAELILEEAKATIEAMDKWLPELRKLANG